MNEKGNDNSKDTNEDERMFTMFLRMLFKNADISKDAFKHDLEPQRRKFIRHLYRLFRLNGKKEGSDK